MLILNKILPWVALPLGVVLLLLMAALVRKQWSLVAVAAGVLYLFSLPIVANRLEYWLEANCPAVPIEQAETADAIVTLSGMFGPPVAEGYVPNLGEANERLEAGIQLWQHKKAPWLVFTAGRVPWQRADEAEGYTSARVAMSRGIPAASIAITGEVGNTADEARVISQVMRERGWHKVLLVTSANHMPRAALLFRQASVAFVPFAVDFHVDPKHKPVLMDFLPNASSLQLSENAIREWYGSAFYRLLRPFR